MRSKSSSAPRVRVEFEWYREGKWMHHAPLIPERAVSQAVRDLKAQPNIIRNVRVVGVPR